MSTPGRGSPRSSFIAKLVVISVAIAVGGFLGGVAIGPFLWQQPAPSDPGRTEWPLRISVDFGGAPANATLGWTLSVVDENRTVGSAHFVVSRPAEGGDRVTLFFSQALKAVPQTLHVVFEFDSGGVTDFKFDVLPDTPIASPRPYFTVHYGSHASGFPFQEPNWMVDVSIVG